jgi:polyphosphate glucokinase
VLVVDVGGNSVKVLASGHNLRRSFPSGPKMTPKDMVASVKKLAADWAYDVVSIGHPGPVLQGRPVAEPHNLGRGWVGFDFARAFGRPVKVVNDATMQAMGSYRGGKMLFLGLGTGLGSTMIVDGVIAPMELGHLPYKKGSYEDYVGRGALERHGKAKWRRRVADVVTRLIAALGPDETVIGGGNAKKLASLPPQARAGDNANALRGGFRLWQEEREPAQQRQKRHPARSERIADGCTIEDGCHAIKRQARPLARSARPSGDDAGPAPAEPVCRRSGARRTDDRAGRRRLSGLLEKSR